MTKSDLIEILSEKQSLLNYRDVELAVRLILEQMSDNLATGERIEIRGFGSFTLHHRPPRVGRNPRTNEEVMVESCFVPVFKPSQQFRNDVMDAAQERHQKG